MKSIGRISTTKIQHENFKNGSLIEIWANSYPQIFDKEDIRLANSQGVNGYHFYEWLGAITIFNTMGYLSLIEKYGMKPHLNKLSILKEVVDEKTYHYIISSRPKRLQFPDLLCYSRHERNWFFCEVKGEGDKIRNVQDELFKEIEHITGKEIMMLKIDKVKNTFKP